MENHFLSTSLRQIKLSPLSWSMKKGDISIPALQASKLHYSKLEKLAFALIIAARRLRQYFQVYSITVLTDQPLKDVFLKVDVAG